MKPTTIDRYQRQMILKGFGIEAQEKLMQAKVLVVGAGGLGCPALLYLAAAGVGTIGIVDDDQVALSNLHRQVIYTTKDVGSRKAEVAAEYLRGMNPDIDLVVYPIRLSNRNAWELLRGYDLVIDGSDNFATRYMVNDACVLLGKPLIYGAVSQFEGQVAAFNLEGNFEGQAVHYRDLFPEPPRPGSIPNCAEAGVLGVLPGIIGSMQAAEAIKIITGIGTTLRNQLLNYSILTHETYLFELESNPETAERTPKNKSQFEALDYGDSCTKEVVVPSIHPAELERFLNRTDVTIVDVREEGELPMITEFAHLHLPLSQFNAHTAQITGDTVIVFCQSGKRSEQAAQLLIATFGSAKQIYHLQNGITGWKLYGS